jgi:replicative DNA helicase
MLRRHAEIEIRPGWREGLHLHIVTITAPGERKSAVQLAMSRCILDVEARLAEAGEGSRLEALTRQQVATEAARRQRNTAATTVKDQQDAALADAIGADDRECH